MATRVRAAIVGTGFIGRVHFEAVRRLGFIDVAAIAGSSVEKARAFADDLGVERAEGDWLDHQLAARELLDLDAAKTHLVVEHEYPKARIQDRERLKPILQGSIAFIRRIDEAAACMYALQHDVLTAQDIPTQGTGREPYRS